MNDLALYGILFAVASAMLGVGALCGWYLRGQRDTADSVAEFSECRRVLAPRSIP